MAFKFKPRALQARTGVAEVDFEFLITGGLADSVGFFDIPQPRANRKVFPSAEHHLCFHLFTNVTCHAQDIKANVRIYTILIFDNRSIRLGVPVPMLFEFQPRYLQGDAGITEGHCDPVVRGQVKIGMVDSRDALTSRKVLALPPRHFVTQPCAYVASHTIMLRRWIYLYNLNYGPEAKI